MKFLLSSVWRLYIIHESGFVATNISFDWSTLWLLTPTGSSNHEGEQMRKFICRFVPHSLFRSRNSAVGITTGYGLDNREFGVRVQNFFFSKSSRPALGSKQPPIQSVAGVKRLRPKADHSLPTSAEIKKIWIYTSTPPYVFMA
jgi:hypothetical protein